MNDTAEKVWQGCEAGFREQLVIAQKEWVAGRRLSASVKYATAYYSHVKNVLCLNPVRAFHLFGKARGFAVYAAEMIEHGGPEKVSHGAYSVVGDILLRGWLWYKPDPRRALAFFNAGLVLPNVPHHSQALLHIGAAEAEAQLGGQNESCLGHIETAISLEEKCRREENQPDAMRQFVRVLIRAACLYKKIGYRDSAEEVRWRATNLLVNPKVGTESMRRKAQLARWMMYIPQFLRFLVPL